MSKVVFVSYSNVSFLKTLSQDGFIDGFANALARLGNEVCCFLTNRVFIKEIESNIINAKPDVIIAFNNSGITENVIKNTNCPILCFGSDSVSFWAKSDLIEKYFSRYYFLHHSTDTYSQAKEIFKNFPEDKNFMFSHATDLRKIDIEQDIPISFVGSIGNWDKSGVEYFKRMSKAVEFLPEKYPYNMNEIKAKYISHINDILNNPLTVIKEELPLWRKFASVPYKQSLITNVICLKRFSVLRELEDLSIKIFSYPEAMVDVLTYDINLFNSFDFTTSTTLEDNTITYNRSKISLNLPHAHAQNGFSWRVCEVMASNAFLLSDYRPDLDRLMKPYFKDFPMYHNSKEAYELAKKILKDDKYRLDLVEASNKAIEENCRFEPRIKQIEELIKVKLVYDDKKQGSVDRNSYLSLKLSDREYQNIQKSSKKISFVNKIRYQIWCKLTEKLTKKKII